MSLKLKNWLLKNKMRLLGAFIGAILGFLYWRFIGCSSGSCAITSNPVNSTIYFALAGFFLGSTSKSRKETNGEQEIK